MKKIVFKMNQKKLKFLFNLYLQLNTSKAIDDLTDEFNQKLKMKDEEIKKFDTKISLFES